MRRAEESVLSSDYDRVNEALLKKVLTSPDYRARAAATRVLCYWRDRVKDPLELLRTQVNDQHPRVRLEAVRALSFFNSAKAQDVALESLVHPQDSYLEYTLKETLKGALGKACEKVKELAAQAREKVRQAASLACAAGKKIGKAAQTLPATLSALGKAAWALRRPCAVAVGVGVGVLCGAACYCGGRAFASVANGIGSAAVTLSATVLPLKRLLPFGSTRSD